MLENILLNSFKIDDTKYQTILSNKFLRRKKFEPYNPKKIVAYIPGNISNVFVKEGQFVKMGERLLVLDAMKMKNIILSKVEGKIKSVLVQQGITVVKGQLLIEIE